MSNEKPKPRQRQPMQPIEDDGKGVIRFRGNALVRYLLDKATAAKVCDLNHLARVDFPQEDREQFAQLIGYSVSGFGDLSYAQPETLRLADIIVQKVIGGHEHSPADSDAWRDGYAEGLGDAFEDVRSYITEKLESDG
jgi:hypothetical protein